MKNKIFILLIAVILCFACACSPKQYTVDFNTDAAGVIASQTIKDGGVVARPDDPQKSGYKFVNWYLNGEIYDFSSPVKSDLTLQAQWVQTFTVSFNTEGCNNINSQTVESGALATKPSDPVKEDFSFAGWFFNNEPFDFSAPITQDLELVAKWETQKVSVTYHFYTGETEKVVQDKNSKFDAKIDNVAENLVFDGWYTANGVYYNNENTITSSIDVYSNVFASGFTFEGSTIVGYTGSELQLTLPEYANGVAITTVGEMAFNESKITAITFGKNITTVEDYAFRDCSALAVVNFNQSLMGIGEGAFFNCGAIAKIDIPNSVQEIGYGAFGQKLYIYSLENGQTAVMPDECALSEITIPFIGANLTYSEKSFFSYIFGCSESYLNGYSESGIDMQLGDEVVKVNLYSALPLSLKKVTVKNIEIVPDNAFYGCLYLEEINFESENLFYIGKSAFESCFNANINGIEKVEVIEDRAFMNSGFSGATFTNLTTIGEFAFVNTLIEEFDSPNTLVSIGEASFANTLISEIVIPESVELVDDMAFYGCENLTKIYCLNSEPCDFGEALFTVLVDGVAYYSDVLIYVPNGEGENSPYKLYRKHLYLRDYASGIFPVEFENQTGYIVDEDKLLGYVKENDEDVTEIHVPSGVKEIEDFAFYNLAKIEKVYMSEGFEKIGKYTFYNCTSIKNLYMPSTMKEIDDYAFAGFFVGNNLSRLYFPEGFTRIGDGAFLSSFNLKIINIPSTVNYIGYLAFGMSNSLERMYVNTLTPPTVGFYDNGIEEVDCNFFSLVNAAKTVVYVPSGKITTGENSGKTYLEVYKAAPGFKDFADYIKPTPNGAEVGHYGNGEFFIDLDGCDTATIYTVKKLDEPDEITSSNYAYVKEYGSYTLTGAILNMSFETYGDIKAIYSNRAIICTLNGENVTLKEPKKYYDSYNWTNFITYETEENKGKGMFDMYGYFLTPFEWSISGEVFTIKIDGNNVAPENSAYHGAVEYVGTYDKTTDTFKVALLLNDYIEKTEYTASYLKVVYSTAKEEKLYGTYKCYSGDYVMFTVVSYGDGLCDFYIGESSYLGLSYVVEDNVATVDVLGETITLTVDKDGNLKGNIYGMACDFIYEDELLDSTKLPD